MKIASAQQNLSSSHLEIEHRAVSERLRSWTGNRPRTGNEDRPAANASPVNISPLAQALAANTSNLPSPAAAPQGNKTTAIAAAMDSIDNDPGLAMLRSMLERVFGIHFETFDPAEMNVDTATADNLQNNQASAAAVAGANWGMEYEYHAQRTEVETTRFSAEGLVKTEDGQVFKFELKLEMTRSYSERIDLAFRAGNAARQKDPLLVNFAGNAAQLADQRFEIDLDSDGRNETARFAAQGSGFLVFDRNGDGKINNGKEMFGPSSGDGFAELAALDVDHNGWIDENDAVYAKLKVWTKTAAGSDVFSSLKEANVGAISLSRLATPFAIKDAGNNTLGQVRSSSVYLSDTGQVGTVQQVDLTV